MPRERPLVFVSSTFGMKAERQSVKDALEPPLDVPLYEKEPAPGTSAERECLRLIEATDYWVGIHGADWGSPRDDKESFTEWEFGLARRRASRGLPMFLFLAVDPDDPAVDERQRAFLKRATDFQAVAYQRYEDPSDLADKVRRAVMGWASRVEMAVRRGETDANRRGGRVLVALSFLFLAAAVGAVAAMAAGLVTSSAALAAFAMAAVGLALCLFFQTQLRAPRGPSERALG